MSQQLRLDVDRNDATPIYSQLDRAIRFAISTDRLRIGERLPTVRQLAVDLRINANTVARVYAELERIGVLETRRGIGTFVRARHFEAVPPDDRRRELDSLTNRFLVEADRLGFSLDELITHLESRRKKENV